MPQPYETFPLTPPTLFNLTQQTTHSHEFQGEITKKKKDHLSLTKIYERFSRFALANPDNANGDKVRRGIPPSLPSPPSLTTLNTNLQFVAVVHPRGDGPRRILEHSVLQTASEENDTVGAPALADCSALQCFLRPRDGKDELFRATLSGSEVISVKLLNKMMRDGKGTLEGFKVTAMNEDIVEEVKAHVIKLKTHIEAAIIVKSKSKSSLQGVMSLTADFVLDDNRQLWLCCVNDVYLTSSSSEDSDSAVEEKKSSPSLSPYRPSLPSLDADPTSRPISHSKGRSIFSKKGSGSNAVWICNKGMHELLGLSCWSDTHADGTHSIRMQALFEKWSGSDPLKGPPNPHQMYKMDERSKEVRPCPIWTRM